MIEENNKKHYVVPSMEVYEIEPTQLLAGSNQGEIGGVDEGLGD